MNYILKSYEKLIKEKLGNTPHLTGASPTIVCGGPCICFSRGDPSQLSLQDLVDCLVPSIFASKYEVPFYLFFQSYESNLMADLFRFDPKEAHYEIIKEFLLKGISIIFDEFQLKMPNIIIIDTAEPHIVSILDRLTKEYEKFFKNKSLYGLYSSDGNKYPKDMPEEAVLINVYKRNVLLYTDSFFENLFNIDGTQSRLYVQNLTQKNAIEYMEHNSLSQIHGVYFYNPPLNSEGREMNLGSSNYKMKLSNSNLELIRISANFSDEKFDGHDFYQNVFPKYEVSKIMNIWKDICKV